MAVKTDWEFHIQNYVEHFSKQGVTPTQYARELGLPEGSARRNLKAFAPEKQPSRSGEKKPRSAASRSAKSNNEKTAKTKAKKASERDGKRTPESRSGSSDRKTSTPRVRARNRRRGGSVNNFNPETGLYSFKNGNDAGIVHGGYASFVNLSPEVREAAEELANGRGGVELLATARYLEMTKSLRIIAEDVEANYSKEPPEPSFDEEGREQSKDRALATVLIGPSQRMTELEKALDSIKLNREKLELEKRKLSIACHQLNPTSKAEQIEITKELLQRRIDEDLTALETAKLFEIEGVRAPHILTKEAEREIHLIEPEVDDEGGVTDDELEAEAREYLAESDSDIMDLPNRRKRIKEKLLQESLEQAAGMLSESEFDQVPRDDADQEEYAGV